MRVLVSGLSVSLLLLGGCAEHPRTQVSRSGPVAAAENVTLDSLPEAKLTHCSHWNDPTDPYPKEARVAQIQGRALVEFGIEASGRVKGARIVADEPAGVFGKVALSYVQGYRCPGTPMDHKYRLSFVYTIIPCPRPAPCQAPEPYATKNLPIIVTAGTISTY